MESAMFINFSFWSRLLRPTSDFSVWGNNENLKKKGSSYDETFKLLKAEVSTESLSEALCLYSFSKAAVAKDCKSGLSLSSLFRPFESCAIADEHW